MRKASKLRKRIERSAGNRLLTLTWRRTPSLSLEEESKAIKRSWSLMRRRIARKLGVKTIKYILIQEWTINQAPHLHIILDSPYIHQRILSGMWKASSGYGVVDIRQIKTMAGTAHYLAKYLAKDRYMPPKQRKYTCSRGQLVPALPRVYTEDEEKPEIRHGNTGPGTAARIFQEQGWSIMALGETEYLALPPQRLRRQPPAQLVST